MKAFLPTQVVAIEQESVTLSDDQNRVQKVPNDSVIVQAGGTPPAQLLGSFGIQMVTKYGEA